MRIGMSIRGLGYHPAAWRHPDVPVGDARSAKRLKPAINRFACRAGGH